MDMYAMATSIEHNNITQSFVGTAYPLKRAGKLHTFCEEVSLVHYGRFGKGETLSLVEIEKIDDRNDFIENTIELLEYKQPDFMCFKDENKFITNKRKNRIAGCPNLIVEVWSPGNVDVDKNEKFKLYSSSQLTEYWSINYQQRIVECYVGGQKNWEKSINQPLVTRWGFEFDLAYLYK